MAKIVFPSMQRLYVRNTIHTKKYVKGALLT